AALELRRSVRAAAEPAAVRGVAEVARAPAPVPGSEGDLPVVALGGGESGAALRRGSVALARDSAGYQPRGLDVRAAHGGRSGAHPVRGRRFLPQGRRSAAGVGRSNPTRELAA